VERTAHAGVEPFFPFRVGLGNDQILDLVDSQIFDGTAPVFHRVLGNSFPALGIQALYLFRVKYLHLAGSFHKDGLQEFGTEHRPVSAAGSDPLPVGDTSGKIGKVFAGRSDGKKFRAFDAVSFHKPVFHFGDRFSPDLRGVA